MKPKTIETTVETSRLQRAAKLCAATADHRSPILPYQSTMVRLSVDGCDLTATNGQVSTRATVTAGAPFGDIASVCVSAKRLLDVVNRAPDGYLQLLIKGDKLLVSSGPGKMDAEIVAMPARDFPETSFPSEFPLVDREPLALLVRRTSFAADPVQGGIRANAWLERKKGALSCWATNTKLVAWDSFAASGADFSGSVHADVIGVFLSAVEATEDATVGLVLGDTIAVDAAGVVVTAKTQGPNQMDWRRAIPGGTMTLSCVRADLLEAVGRAALFATPEKPNMNMAVNTSEAGVRVSSAGNSAAGNASTLVECQGARAPLAYTVSWRYVADALRAIDTDRVDLIFAGQVDPLVIRPTGVPDGQMYLIAAMDNT